MQKPARAAAAIVASGGLVRSLTKYHPERACANILRLEQLLAENPPLQMKAWQKVDIITSACLLLEHKRTNMLQKTFLMLRNAAPDPIPVAGLFKFAQTLSLYPNNEFARQIWDYLKHNYALQLGEFDHLLKLLLRIFAQSNKELAGQVMDILAPKATEPSVAAVIMQTLNKFQQYDASLEIGESTQPTREVQGAIAIALLGTGDDGKVIDSPAGRLNPPLTAQELASAVRIKARHSLESAERMVDAFDAPDRHKRRAVVALVERSIELGDVDLFDKYMARYTGISGHSSGMAMNLRIKWHLGQDDFERAREAFQLGAINARVTAHHRVLGHRKLKAHRGLSAENKEWLQAAAKSLLYTR